MGNLLFDQYSLLHFACGIIAHFWDISLKNWFIAHAIFEAVENTNAGMSFINNYIQYWPGGKSAPDTLINSVGDQIAAILGWLFAEWWRNY